MPAQDAIDDLNRYLAEGMKETEGWCSPHLWQLIWPLAAHLGSGPVYEIGVYAGKFFIGLAKTFPEAQMIAIDVFADQQFNVDRSGTNAYGKFIANLEAQNIADARVSIHQGDSLALSLSDVIAMRQANGPAAFFSVDGCHEMLHTYHDIELAMQLTASTGLIAIDDYYNPDWPGVQEAVAKLYHMREMPFVPLAYSEKKLFLCHRPYHQAYLDRITAHVRAHHPDTRLKKVRRFGYDTVNVMPKPSGTQVTRLGDQAH